jgi:hypothetical protein
MLPLVLEILAHYLELCQRGVSTIAKSDRGSYNPTTP